MATVHPNRLTTIQIELHEPSKRKQEEKNKKKKKTPGLRAWCSNIHYTSTYLCWRDGYEGNWYVCTRSHETTQLHVAFNENLFYENTGRPLSAFYQVQFNTMSRLSLLCPPTDLNEKSKSLSQWLITSVNGNNP